jgi:hypothetical protein
MDPDIDAGHGGGGSPGNTYVPPDTHVPDAGTIVIPLDAGTSLDSNLPFGCQRVSVVVTPDVTPTDGCVANYECDDGLSLVVQCDGENDGTDTSLCSCHSDTNNWYPDELFAGEGPESCLGAALRCLELMP